MTDRDLHDLYKEIQSPPARKGFHDELRATLEDTTQDRPTKNQPNRGRHQAWRRAAVSIAAASVLAATVFGTSTLLGGNAPQANKTGGTTPVGQSESTSTTAVPLTLAGVVKQKLEATSRSMKSVQLNLRQAIKHQEAGAAEDVSLIRIGSNGNLWHRTDFGSGGSLTESYDAAKRTLSSYRVDSMGKSAHISENDPGPGDLLSRLGFGYGEYYMQLPQLLDENSTAVREVTYEGKDAWELESRMKLDLFGISPDHAVITIDKETGLPMYQKYFLNGELLAEYWMTDVRANPEFSDSDFTISVPAGVERTRSDSGYRRVSSSEATKLLGNRFFEPTTLPDGYEFMDLTYTSLGPRSGAEGMNPPSEHLLTWTYRKGISYMEITTRSALVTFEDGGSWIDPYSSEGLDTENKRVVLTGGAFRDLAAEVTIRTPGTPHLWLKGTTTVLAIKGPLTTDELLATANGMQRPSTP